MVKDNKKKVIIKHPHAADCWAVKAVEENDWYSPWYLPQEPIFYGDRAGGRRGDTCNWVVFSCNATNCKAWGLVRQMTLEDFIHDLTKEQK